MTGSPTPLVACDEFVPGPEPDRCGRCIALKSNHRPLTCDRCQVEFTDVDAKLGHSFADCDANLLEADTGVDRYCPRCGMTEHGDPDALCSCYASYGDTLGPFSLEHRAAYDRDLREARKGFDPPWPRRGCKCKICQSGKPCPCGRGDEAHHPHRGLRGDTPAIQEALWVAHAFLFDLLDKRDSLHPVLRTTLLACVRMDGRSGRYRDPIKAAGDWLHVYHGEDPVDADPRV